MTDFTSELIAGGQNQNVYDSGKAKAVVSRILELQKGVAGYYYLAKLLYIIERRSLVEKGRPVFYDQLFSVKLGPIASNALNDLHFITANLGEGWGENFSINNNRVSLKRHADYSVLSPYEERIIGEEIANLEKILGLSKLSKSEQFNRLKDYMHNNFPEYVETDKQRIPINYETILEKEGFEPSEIKRIINEHVDYCLYLRRTLH